MSGNVVDHGSKSSRAIGSTASIFGSFSKR